MTNQKEARAKAAELVAMTGRAGILDYLLASFSPNQTFTLEEALSQLEPDYYPRIRQCLSELLTLELLSVDKSGYHFLPESATAIVAELNKISLYPAGSQPTDSFVGPNALGSLFSPRNRAPRGKTPMPTPPDGWEAYDY